MTGIEGRPASVLLAQRPGRADTLVERIGGWLLRWNSATAEETALTRELLDSEVLGPARAAGVLDSYLSELEGRCQALEGRAVKLVAAHNDLTTANVLVAQGRPLGVVDWDTAQRRALPLGDLFYALADAQAATNGFADRLQAFIARFDGPVSAIETEVTKTLGVDGDIADLCFHACWLRHAANESRRAEAEERPFLDIVHAIAEQRIRMGG
jgi:thiamine kinase-like enzyme